MQIQEYKGVRTNYQEIVNLIEANSSVLDLGCGSGILLKQLIDEKNVRGRGIDIDENKLVESIKNGISVRYVNQSCRNAKGVFSIPTGRSLKLM